MQLVVQEFQERVAEIESYLDFVRTVSDGSTLLRRASDNTPAYTSASQDNLLRTFKASALLMLYNLMESSVKNSVESIFDELEKQTVSFDDCREEIRLVVLGNMKQHSAPKLLSMLSILTTDVVTETFRKADIFSGNIDAREIKGVARQYGFSEPKSRGDRLLTVKTQRNDLAHGSKSFAEVGRSFSVEDILQIKQDVIDYLREMLNNITAYLDAKSYLIAPTTNA
jgi:MAE_28990/MAE_18760-like HEPN